MTGPATNAATIATVWKLMGRTTAVIYLATVTASALSAGLLLDWVFSATHTHAQNHRMWMLPGWVSTLCAVLLIAVLVVALRPERKKKEKSCCHG